MVQLDRLGPFVPVKPSGKGQPVRAGVGRIAGAKLLPVSEPDASLAVNPDLRVGVARGLLIQNVLITAVRGLWDRDLRSGQFGGRPHQLAVRQADDTDRAAGVERLAVSGVESSVVLAPEFRAFFVGNPQAAG